MLVSRRIGQFFTTLDDDDDDDDDALNDMKGSCREYTFSRSEESSRVTGWIRGNTKIGPVLDVKVCFHQGRCSVEIMIESLFRDRTVSWVRIVNGINTHVTETTEVPVQSIENVRTEKLVAKATPRPKPAVTLSPFSFLFVKENG